jgi:hypothetical protein
MLKISRQLNLLTVLKTEKRIEAASNAARLFSSNGKRNEAAKQRRSYGNTTVP